LIPDTKGGTQRVFENRVLKGIFEPNGGKVTGGWKRLHNEEPSIITVINKKG
jgi:hypothetical protein